MSTWSPSSRDTELASFGVKVHPEGAGARVVPVGELDIATAGRIDERLRELEQAGCRAFVLHLRRLTFLDSTGLRLVCIGSPLRAGMGSV